MQKKIKVLAIAPYDGLKDLIQNVAKEKKELEVDAYVGNMFEGLEILQTQNIETYDLIVSRAGTADIIKKATNLPVIDIKLSILDMMRAIKLTQNYSGKFAIVGFKSITTPASILCELNDYNIKIVTLESSEEIDQSLHTLKEQGISLIVGDVITTRHAKSFGLNTILVTSGKESVYNALSEAIQLYKYLHDNQEKNKLMHKINEHLDNTIISFNANHEVTYTNINIDEEKNGQEILQVTKNLIEILRKEKETQLLQTIGETQYMIKGTMLFIQDSLYPTFYIKKQPPVLKPLDKAVTYKNRNDTPQMKFEAFPTANGTFKKIIAEAKAYSQTNIPIIIYGNKGTGKNMLAHAIYQNSNLRNNPMVIINAKYMNEKKWENLFESSSSPFVYKDYTIYIRNIHFLNEKSQMILESYLSNTNVHKRNRFIFTCMNGYSPKWNNSPLLDLIQNDMAAFPLILPNLNQRKEDIPSLVSIFLSEFIPKYGKQIIGLKKEALALLQAFDWTYNIDQLRKIVEELIVLTDDYYVEAETVQNVLANESSANINIGAYAIDITKTLDEINKDLIEYVLSEENYNHSKAAKRLGISRSTLWRKVKYQ